MTSEMQLGRRTLIKLGLGASAASALACSSDYQSPDKWWQGDIQHILPLTSHQAFNIKISFVQARDTSPVLKLDEQRITGEQQDTRGRFWAFRTFGLQANREYRLQLIEPSGEPLCDSWPLRTFPGDDDAVEKLSIAAYTCAGGPDLGVFPGGWHGFKPASYRQKLYDIMLAKNPDLVVSNGDHIYWDYESWVENMKNGLAKKAMHYFLGRYGHFNDTIAVLGTTNEAVLTNIADEQIAGTYGVRFRSTPVVFVTDDHDYFDNDDASPKKVTFPPNDFHQQLRDYTQQLYFPEFIAEDPSDQHLPGHIGGTSPQLSTHFGAIRYGKLFAAVFYDCGGMLDLDGLQAGLVPGSVEHWLHRHTAKEDTAHFAHFPSHPFGWTAGKWREWYPDLLQSSGTLLADIVQDETGGKYKWQQGWWLQHQRILQSIAAQQQRAPLIVSGDLHLLGAGQLEQSGESDFSDKPITSILSGPVGVGDLGWLSAARGVTVATPEALTVNELSPPEERNGFTFIEFIDDQCKVELFGCPEGYVEPDTLTVTSRKSFTI